MRLQMTQEFKQASVVLPVMDEVQSLQATIQILREDNKTDLCEVILVVCNKTTQDSRALCESLQQQDPSFYKLVEQQRPFLGGAIRDAFDVFTGSHVIIMASDLETDPRTVKDFILASKKAPQAIVTASRWVNKSFHGYSWPKYFANYFFQKIFAVLYGAQLSDMTFGFRIFPSSVVKNIRWTETRHAFLFETVIKPLRLGVAFIEVPSAWKARPEGISHASLFETAYYVSVGIRVLFQTKRSLLRE